jgi:hypothetical protein
MTKLPYQQEATLAEKLLAHEEATLAGTRRAYTEIVEPSAGGRWKKPAQPSDPAKLYPPLPASSPWHHDPVPDEEPLGFSVEEMPVMGEPWEAERAAAILEVAAGLVPPPSPDSGHADLASPLLRSANSAGQSPATPPPPPQLPDVAAATARPFSKPSFRRIG